MSGLHLSDLPRLDPFMVKKQTGLIEWARRERALSPGASARPGPIDHARLPYLVEVARALENLAVRNVSVMKAAQVGFTELILSFVAWSLCLPWLRCNILFMVPNQEVARRVAKSKVNPLFEQVQTLRELIPPGSKKNNNELLQKPLPHGSGGLYLTGSETTSFLRGIAARVFIVDDLDGCTTSISGEGSPVTLGHSRTNTFDDRKHVHISSPATKPSMIEGLFEQGNMMRFYVPCQGCGVAFALFWRFIQWDEGKPETVRLVCPRKGCGHAHHERDKRAMLRGGVWLATNHDAADPSHVSFHLSALYSPMMTWEAIAWRWIECKGDNEALRTFINTILGESWELPESKGEDFSALVPRLLSRKEHYGNGDEHNPMPAAIKWPLVTVDVQKDRLEVLSCGFSDTDFYPLQHQIINGDPCDIERGPWVDVAGVVRRHLHREDDKQLIHLLCVIDGAFLSGVVCEFVRRSGRGFLAVKGVSGLDKPLYAKHQPKRTMHGTGNINLVQIGTEAAKNVIYSLLLSENASRFHVPAWADRGWCEQLLSERRQVAVDQRGYQKIRFILPAKGKRRNEVLDLCAMAWCGLAAIKGAGAR